MHMLSVPVQSEPLDIQNMLIEMDQALTDEVVKQSNYKQIKHTAIDGTLVSEGNGQYIYQFTLTEPWEPQDDAPLTVANKTTQKNSCTVVTSKGTTITIAADAPLSPNLLCQIDFCDDSTELLKRLQESLKHVAEGHAKLGSKSFGVLPSNNIFHTPTTITFGPIFPHQNQMKAAQMALSGEVTYIVGPPGTGKTLTLAAIAFEHIRAGRTVLIAAHTNIAIDNAIMKLCELCKDTGNTPLLQQGFVVRYGAVQKEELKTNERYSEVYLPKIAQRLGKTLHLQKEGLKKSLHNLAKKLSDLQQQQQQNKEQYDSQSTPIKRQLELLQKELAPLEQEERQRVSSLHAQRKQFVLHLQRTEHELTDAQQRLARTKAGIEESRIALVTCRQDEQRWLTQLIDARAMSKVKRFFKGIRCEKLEMKVAEATQRIYEIDQKLVTLRQELEMRHTTLSQQKQKKQFCEEAYNHINIELNTPSNTAQRIQRISEQASFSEHSLREIEATYEYQQRVYQQEIPNGEAQRSTLEQQLATIDQQLRDIEQSIVAQARVVGTTLSKTYMNKTIADRRFDVVILDEVSMAPLPLVYIAASHANSSVTLIGDPQQLAPIVNAETPLAKKWLGRDLFELRRISLEGAIQGYNHSIMLNVQSRMPPQISAIVQRHVYDNYLKNGSHKSEKIEPLPEAPLLLCDTSDASPSVTKPKNGGSRKNYYHAMCCVALAHKVLNAAPEMNGKSEPSIGIVTPYRPQAQLLQKLIMDAGLQKLIQAGTVHRFQGLEFDVVIFDTVESSGLGMKSNDFISGTKGSGSMRLVNVAVTRPKQKLIIVANSTYIQQAMPIQSTLRLAVNEAAEAAVIQSLDVVGMSFASYIEKARKLSPYVDSTAFPFTSTNVEEEVLVHSVTKNKEDGDIESYNEKTLYDAIRQDIQAAQVSIIIGSPFLAQERVNDILPLLVERQREGVRVTVYTKPEEESEWWSIRAAGLLKAANIELLYKPKMHQKLVFIDKKIEYNGSLNLLSHRDTGESVLRITIPRIVQEQLGDFLNSAEELQKKAFVDDVALQELKEIVLSVKALPSINTGCGCGSPLVPRLRRDGSGAFYGCSNYKNCSQKSTENISLLHLEQIKSLKTQTCPRCKGSTSLKIQSKPQGILLICDTRCGGMQKITFTR